MPKSDKERSKKLYASKKSKGMVKRCLWCYPQDWAEIKAFCNDKTDKRELINSVDSKGMVK